MYLRNVTPNADIEGIMHIVIDQFTQGDYLFKTIDLFYDVLDILDAAPGWT